MLNYAETPVSKPWLPKECKHWGSVALSKHDSVFWAVRHVSFWLRRRCVSRMALQGYLGNRELGVRSGTAPRIDLHALFNSCTVCVCISPQCPRCRRREWHPSVHPGHQHVCGGSGDVAPVPQSGEAAAEGCVTAQQRLWSGRSGEKTQRNTTHRLLKPTLKWAVCLLQCLSSSIDAKTERYGQKRYHSIIRYQYFSLYSFHTINTEGNAFYVFVSPQEWIKM